MVKNLKANINLSRNNSYRNEMPKYKYNLLDSLQEAFGVETSTAIIHEDDMQRNINAFRKLIAC